MNPTKVQQSNEAAIVRKRMLELMHKSQASHIGTCLSVIEILLAVYNSIDIDKIKQKKEDRDRVIVSKGHCAAAVFTILNHFGLIEDKVLETYHQNGSRLAGHVTASVAGVEHSTGALGHGLSVATGIGIGLKTLKYKSGVFVIVGDGELQEGSCWEAIQSAAHLKLDNLCLIVDYNKLSGVGNPNDCCNLEPLKAKLTSFGFDTYEIDGHNTGAIMAAIKNTQQGVRPSALICHTIKGKGVSFMENQNVWHYRPLNAEDYGKAIAEVTKEE
jgi:transketolase